MRKKILTSILALFAISSPSQNIDKTVPAEFKNLITQKEYEDLLDQCVNYFKPLPRDFTVKDGAISFSQSDTTEIRHSLENLVRLVAGKTKTGSTKEIVKDFFDAYYHPKKIDVHEYKIAKELLCVRIYHELFLGDRKYWKNFVYRDELEELKTVVVLDLPEGFELVDKKMTKSWNIPEQELFEVALKNTKVKEFKTVEKKFDGVLVFAFLSGDYSASQLPFFNTLVPKSVGKFGSLISIPAKGTLIIHPINKNDLTETFKVFNEKALPIYNEDPGKITDKYYWFYNGKFHLVDKNGEQNIVPEDLAVLFK